MKLAYKISIPISILVTLLLLIVTYTSNQAQREIINEGQELSKKIIFEELEKNKKEALEKRKLEVNLFFDEAISIAVDYLEPKKDIWLPENFLNSEDPLAKMLREEQKEVNKEELSELKEDMNRALEGLTKYKIIKSIYIKSFLNDKEDVFIGESKKEKNQELQKDIISKKIPNKVIGYVRLEYSDEFIKNQFNQAHAKIIKDLTKKK